jgi:nucleoside-diphosphate-sugar epimerase
MRVLVTGGAGYLGSILCEHLLDAGHQVVVLDNLLFQQASLFHLCARPGFEFVRGGARDESTVEKCMTNVDVMIPLAAIVGAPACDANPIGATSTNLDAIRMINRLRSKSQWIIYPTTNSGYGTKSGDVYCTEETPLEPVSLYGTTKVDAENEVLNSPNGVTLRLATVFGTSPRMRLDLLVNHFTYAAVTDRYLVIFEKDFKRNFIHIRDVADAFLFAIEHREQMQGRAFNVGLETGNLSKADLAMMIQKQVPNFYVHYAEVGSDPDKRNYIVSNERLRKAGFEAKRSLDEGIKELIRAYRMLPLGTWRNA